MTTLTYADRHALGLRARQQLARSGHSTLDAAICPADPIAVLTSAMKGRIPELLQRKYKLMTGSPFVFLRGAVPIMAADLACQPHTGILTQLCGDAHIENLGAYESADGRIVFDINDFDESIRGPFEWDVKRMATSLLLAGRDARISREGRRVAVAKFTASYRGAMHRFARMPVIELARYQIHRLAHSPGLAPILQQARRGTPTVTLDRYTGQGAPKWHEATAHRNAAGTMTPGKTNAKTTKATGDASPFLEVITEPKRQLRRFREGDNIRLLQCEEALTVIDALKDYAATLAPERRHFLAQYRPVDVMFKAVGTGSLGLFNYVVYMEGHARPEHTDPLFLQIKEEPRSAYVPYLHDEVVEYANQGHRVVDGQRAMQLTSDPFLGYTRIGARDFLVRQFNDHKASIDTAKLKAESLQGHAELCGELLARGHARSGDPVVISAYLGTSGRFDEAILRFARTYADKTERDCKALKAWRKQQPGSSH